MSAYFQVDTKQMSIRTVCQRRRWGDDFKRRVVAEASAPGASVASVARRYDLNANQVFNWRRRFRNAGSGGKVFLPVTVSEPVLSSTSSGISEPGLGEIEITLASGDRVRIQGDFDPAMVGRLLKTWQS